MLNCKKLFLSKKIFRNCLGKSVPTLLLGGGGYNAQLTARLWTTLTAAALRAPALGPEIPADDQVANDLSTNAGMQSESADNNPLSS